MIDMTQRYFVFIFESYYPRGGMDDLVMTSNEVKECTDFIFKYEWECTGGFQIYDTLTHEIVKGRKPQIRTTLRTSRQRLE